jgi:hypothetical protein
MPDDNKPSIQSLIPDGNDTSPKEPGKWPEDTFGEIGFTHETLKGDGTGTVKNEKEIPPERPVFGAIEAGVGEKPELPSEVLNEIQGIQPHVVDLTEQPETSQKITTLQDTADPLTKRADEEEEAFIQETLEEHKK